MELLEKDQNGRYRFRGYWLKQWVINDQKEEALLTQQTSPPFENVPNYVQTILDDIFMP